MEFATKLGLDVRIQVRPSRSEFGKVIVADVAQPRASRGKAVRRKA